MGTTCSSPKKKEKLSLSPTFQVSSSSPPKRVETVKASRPSADKILQVQTTAKDIMGLGTQSPEKADMLNLSLTDIVQNLAILIKSIIGLIESVVKKSQLLKAICRRIQSLQSCFSELQKKTSQFSKEPVVNLLFIVKKIKEEIQKILSTEKSLWERFKDVVMAQSQLDRLVYLNEELTRAQADLAIPLQLDEASEMKKILDNLKELEKQNIKIYQSLQNQTVVPLAQKYLTNEEAFQFWLSNIFYF